jgi:hypothetical protein
VLNNNVPLFWNSIKAEMFGLQRLLVWWFCGFLLIYQYIQFQT